MIQDEKVTMFVDFSHLSRFNFENNEFLQSIVKKFVRYEEDMRIGLSKFIDQFKANHAKNAYYQISIYNLPTINKIRDLKTGYLGQLMSIHGTVTRTTDTKPELIKGAFSCLDCRDGIVKNVEQ